MAASSAYEDLLGRLLDVEDPPLPHVTYPLRDMTAAEKREHTLTMSIFLLGFAVISALCFYFDLRFWGWVFGVLAALFLVGMASSKGPVAPCPFCSETLSGFYRGMPRHEMRCDKCSQYCVVEHDIVRALDPDDENETQWFKSPLFDEALWPRACVACGAPPTRLLDATGRAMQVGLLFVGRVAVSQASAVGIPYCQEHEDGLKVKVKQGRGIELHWSSLRMMRRYLAANT